MSAFDNFNNKSLNDISEKLNIDRGRLSSYGPCPACNAKQRGSTDRRLPLGTTPNSKGWHCHKCKASGNMIDLLCFKLIGSRYSEANSDNKKLIINWLVDNGYGTEDYKKSGSNLVSIKQTINKSNNDKEEAVPVDTTSSFRWHPEIYSNYKSNLSLPLHAPVYRYLTQERKITDDAINQFDLGSMIDDKGNFWLVIPLKDDKGKVINLKFRSVPPNKKSWRHCRGRPLPLFNGNNITNDRSEYIIITEGELDVIAMYSYGFKKNVVSGTCGATANWKEEWLNLLEPYQGFFLWYDNDSAGNDGAEKLATRLGKFRTFRVQSDENDVSDCLALGKDQEYISNILEKNVSPYLASSLKRADHYLEEIEQLILNPQSLIGKPTGLRKLDPLIGGIRPGLWVVSGDTGHGKTTFITWMLWEQALRGTPVMVTSFEQRPIGTVQKLLRCQVGGDFTSISPENRKSHLEDLGNLPIHILDHYGGLEPAKVIESIRFSVRRYDIEIALVDHLGFLIDSSEKDERQAIETVVRELATIAVQDEITIILICHPNNMAASQQRRVKITDLKGASAIRQDAHVGIIVERNEMSQDSMFPTTTLWVDKVRSEFGRSGSHCTLAFDPLSCVYADTWEETPSGKDGKIVIAQNEA